MLYSMAFDRKWVSDTNLDKLWSDTLEKKEANKLRRSPDFCKEAILSATLKRISSEMLMRRLSAPTVETDITSDDEDDTLTVLTSVTGLMDCDEQINFFKALPDEKSIEKPESENTVTQHRLTDNDKKINSVSDLCAAIEMTEIEPIPKSPKRKWSDTEESDTETLKTPIQCSPAKRSRPKDKLREKNSKVSSPRRKRSQSPVLKDSVTNCEKSKKRLFTLPKVKIIPAEEDDSSSQKTELNMALLTPVRSVVNSISELSIEVDDTIKSSDSDTWCLNVHSEPIHSDPLELDGFFNNLRKVTS